MEMEILPIRNGHRYGNNPLRNGRDAAFANVKADVPDGLFQIMLGALLMLAGMLNLFILLPERAAKAFNLKEFGLR